MADRLRCPNGHYVDAADTTPDGFLNCPRCRRTYDLHEVVL